MSWDFLTESRLKLNVPSVNDFKQITGIEPASPAWEAGVLPMNYICEKGLVSCANDNIIAYPPEKSRAKTRKCENPEM